MFSGFNSFLEVGEVEVGGKLVVLVASPHLPHVVFRRSSRS